MPDWTSLVLFFFLLPKQAGSAVEEHIPIIRAGSCYT